MTDVGQIVNWFVSPTNTYDACARGIALGLLIFTPVWWLLSSAKRTFRIILSLSVIALTASIYTITLLALIPHLSRFSDDHYGILLPSFSGASLSEVYGDVRLNQVIQISLKKQFRQLGIDSLVDIQTVSWKAGSYAIARKLYMKYNADAILWGSVTKLLNGARLDLHSFTGVFVLRDPYYFWNADSTAFFEVEMNRGSDFDLNLAQETYNLDTLVNTFVSDAVIAASTKLCRQRPKLLSVLATKTLSVDYFLRHSPFGMIFILSTADAMAANVPVSRSNHYWEICYQNLITNLENCQSDTSILIFPASVYRRLASFTRLQQARICATLGDSARAKQYFCDAADLEPMYRPQIFEMLTLYLYSETWTNSRQQFVDINCQTDERLRRILAIPSIWK